MKTRMLLSVALLLGALLTACEPAVSPATLPVVFREGFEVGGPAPAVRVIPSMQFFG